MKSACKKAGIISRIVPIILHVNFMLVSLYCLYMYHTAVGTKDNLYACYVMFTTMFLNSLVALTMFGCEESYSELRMLLDYAQLSLVLPCYGTGIWLIKNAGGQEVAWVPALFGIGALLFFILMEYKRQDLTDLALIISGIAVMIIGIIASDYVSMGAAAVQLGGYFFMKRKETCSLDPSMAYNYVMVVYNVMTLAALGPDTWVPEF